MKKLALSTLIVPLIFALASCESSPSHNCLQTQDDAFAPNIAYLVLGKNGLYNGEKGENIAELFLENTVVYSGAPGDALPSADAITSTSSDVVFETWIRYDGEGKPTPYSKVPNDSNAILYAFYSYDGDLNAGDGSATTEGGGGEIGQQHGVGLHAEGAELGFAVFKGVLHFLVADVGEHEGGACGDGLLEVAVDVGHAALCGAFHHDAGSDERFAGLGVDQLAAHLDVLRVGREGAHAEQG